MFLLRLAAMIIFCTALGLNSACFAELKIGNLIIDNSDRMILLKGSGSYKTQSSFYIPIADSKTNTISIITNPVNTNAIKTSSLTDPKRYIIDIPNASLIGQKRTYEYINSKKIKLIRLSQFSINPNIVRVVIEAKEDANLALFKTYTNGKNIIIKYDSDIIDNSIQYKFYTPSGDGDKGAVLQNTKAKIIYNNNPSVVEVEPKMQGKYYLSKVTQGSNGLILRGVGALSMQRVTYNPEGKKAEIILDNAILSKNLENKTYDIPNQKATLTLEKFNEKKIKLTLLADNYKDYRYIISPDGQSLFVADRTFIINTAFSANPARVLSYKLTKTKTDYVLFNINFDKPAAYNVFELNDNFYLDIDNLSDYNISSFEQMLKNQGIKIEALKISNDKTRFIIPTSDLNFSYANVESNAKSITLCFKNKTVEQKPVEKIEKPETKKENINVIYVPKNEDIDKKKAEKPKKKKENLSISTMRKVVIDPGHGGADTGAVNNKNYEKTLNLIVAKLVYDKLIKKNIYVHMTRTKDVSMSLEERVNFSNEISPDIFVSIHANSTVAKDPLGLETHYFKDDSHKLAQTIHKHFASEKNVNKWQTKDRGVIKSRFYVINHTEAPSVLIEMGFISNDEELSKLITKQRQQEIADAIVKGILEYLKAK